MYLGIENPNGHPNKYFYKGQIFEHAIFNSKISNKEVDDLFNTNEGDKDAK